MPMADEPTPPGAPTPDEPASPRPDLPMEPDDALTAAAAEASAESQAEQATREAVPTGPPMLMFGRWDLGEVTVNDAGLKRYINLQPVYLPHTGARHANRPFAKSHVNIVERFINLLMRSEDYTGKKSKAYIAVRDAFEELHTKTKKNPVQLLVQAVENAAPREEVTRLRYGGISVPKAVDVSPARRLDVALRNLATGASSASFKSPRPIHECIATEILRASKGEMESYAVAKKEELERVAKSAR